MNFKSLHAVTYRTAKYGMNYDLCITFFNLQLFPVEELEESFNFLKVGKIPS